VLLTTLKSFGLLVESEFGRLDVSDVAREHLLPGAPFAVNDYLGLAADSPGVAGAGGATAEQQTDFGQTGRGGGVHLPRGHGLGDGAGGGGAAADAGNWRDGRATSPRSWPARLPLADARVLLDVGGGTGIYSIACLQKNPGLRAVVWDRPEVLKVAGEMARGLRRRPTA